MAGQTRIDGNLIDTGTDPNDIVSVSVGDSRYATLGTDGLSVESTFFFENEQTLNTSYVVATDRNAMTIGPITLADNVGVTVNGRWVII